MNCEKCLCKNVCKYTEEVVAAEKKIAGTINETVKGLPIKPSVEFSIVCPLIVSKEIESEKEIKPSAEPVKRKRRTKKEIEAEKAAKECQVEVPVREEETDLAEEMGLSDIEITKEEPASLEETFTEIEEEKETVSLKKNPRESEILEMKLDDMLALNTSEEIRKEILEAGIVLVKDVYDRQKVSKLNTKSIEALNNNLKIFNLETI